MKWLSGDLSKAIRLFPEMKITAWGITWGHWAIAIIKHEPHGNKEFDNN